MGAVSVPSSSLSKASVSPRRTRAQMSLIVLHNDSPSSVHYYINADGNVERRVPEERIAQHSGSATWHKHRRNIDRISIGIALEQRSHSGWNDSQLAALHKLLDTIESRYGLDDSAIVRWEPTPERGERVGRLIPFLPPPPSASIVEGSAVGVLGIEDDAAVAQRFWKLLEEQSYNQRGKTFNPGRAFDLYAAKCDLGAPMAPNDPTPLTVDGKVYNFQTFARDTICNEGRNWGAVQSLNSMLGEEVSMPDGGVSRALLEASYAASLKISASKRALKGNQNFHVDWAFHYVAVREHLGPALSGNYVTDDGQYAVQIFAGDTLYTPMSDQSGCLRLSQATSDDPTYARMWTETYTICGAAFDPNSPFHQRAVQDDLGTPLTGVYGVDFDGVQHQVQVWSLDTLYAAPDGVIKRQSALPKAQEVQNCKSTPVFSPPVAPPPVVHSTFVVSTPRVDVNWPPDPDFPCLPSQTARQREFGSFSYVPIGNGNIRITDGWQAQNIISVTIPQLAGISGAPASGTILMHKRATDQMRAIWAGWEAAGLLHLVLNWQGCFVPRFIRGSNTQLSNHAFGTAFDINAPWNKWYSVPAIVGNQGCVRELVQIANQHGFFWGGHFKYGKGLSDGMHFEWARPV